MKIAAEVLLKLLRPRSFRFTVLPKSTQSSRDVLVSTRSSLIHAISPSDQTLKSTPSKSENFLKEFMATTNTFPEPMISTFQSQEIDATKFVRAAPRAVWTKDTLKGDHKSRKLYGWMESKSALQEHQVDEQAFGGDVYGPLNRKKRQ